MRSKVFEITEPLVILFNEMDNLQELATAARLPFTDAQFVNLGIRLIKNMNDFDKGLTEWFDLPTVKKTYIKFKDHFMNVQSSLQQISGPMMQSEILR